jgi:membrane protein insertase Oxa1/YidC/SpoIIIJ
VPSGLCIYFIASTVFALFERRFIPKPKLNSNESGSEKSKSDSNDNSAAIARNQKSKNKRRGNSGKDEPVKKENFIAKWIREVVEKASDERRFEEGRKKKDKKRK